MTHALLVKLVDTLDLGSSPTGWEFESLRGHYKTITKKNLRKESE
jgi:hypothetical protein